MNYRAGFTLVELTIVLGIIALLFAISSLNLSNITPQTSLDGVVQNLIVNLKQQQLSASSNDTGFGIYVSANKYTLFKGNSYNINDISNFDFTPDDITFSTTASGGIILFAKNTGVISGMVGSTLSVNLTQNIISRTSTVTLNKYGIIESIF